MKKIILSATVALGALAFTSCLDSSENSSVGNISYDGNQCVNRVKNPATGDFFITTQPVYEFQLNFTEGTITPTLTNIRLTETGSSYAFRLPAMKATSSETYTYGCSGSGIVPEGQGQSNTFNRFSYKAINRTLRTTGGLYLPANVFDISYTVSDSQGNRYDIAAVPLLYTLVGTTTATAQGATESHQTTKTIAGISLNHDSRTATLQIIDAKFTKDMSHIDLGAKAIPFTYTANGISINTEPGVKYDLYDAAGKVKDAYISDIRLNINAPSGSGSSLSFFVDAKGMIGNSATTTYNVSSDLSYYLPASSDN